MSYVKVILLMMCVGTEWDMRVHKYFLNIFIIKDGSIFMDFKRFMERSYKMC